MSTEMKKAESSMPAMSRADRVSRFFDEMIHTFDEFPLFGRRLSGMFKDELGGEFAPRVDVREDEGGFVVTADLPGMTKDDVNVDVTAHTVTISGEKKNLREEKKDTYHLVERSFGSFSRTVRMPLEIEPEKASAIFKDGVLTASLPKAQKSAATKKTLDIKTEG